MAAVVPIKSESFLKSINKLLTDINEDTYGILDWTIAPDGGDDTKVKIFVLIEQQVSLFKLYALSMFILYIVCGHIII